MGLLNRLLGRDEPQDQSPASKYVSWKGPWLVYNGERVPLDIPGVRADRNASVEIDTRDGRMVQAMHGGKISGCSVSTGSNGSFINGVDLEKYVAQFRNRKDGGSAEV